MLALLSFGLRSNRRPVFRWIFNPISLPKTAGNGNNPVIPGRTDANVVNRVFLLSPARAGGRRARVLAGGQATFELARQTQAGEATLGDVFAFCSGLYFRGKLSYAKTFARPPAGIPGVQVITPSRGLLPADWRIGIADLGEFASVEVNAIHSRFADPLRRTAEALAASGCEVVLLGSIATGKYADCLLPILGSRLVFPSAFVGRGGHEPRRPAPQVLGGWRRVELRSSPGGDSPGQTAREVAAGRSTAATDILRRMNRKSVNRSSDPNSNCLPTGEIQNARRYRERSGFERLLDDTAIPAGKMSRRHLVGRIVASCQHLSQNLLQPPTISLFAGSVWGNFSARPSHKNETTAPDS